MTSDLDIYRSANELIKQFGDAADIEAAMRADECLAAGDSGRQARLEGMGGGLGPEFHARHSVLPAQGGLPPRPFGSHATRMGTPPWLPCTPELRDSI